ncbi:MAG: hypothetical protein ACOYJL_02240 [Tractidigestivibacter sp.]|jgi:hypothetical protein|uniref:hypothetical protein n=1 Tax=Tractidigestivibacter sp. TaxID=2847320 RepID=UPI003D8ED24C
MAHDDEGIYEVPGEDFDTDPEVEEARRAGERALACLNKASEKLRAASGLGLLDIFGGGLITGVAKQYQVSEANDALAAADDALRDFQRELGDVDESLGIDPKVMTGFWSFADLVFDGPISDVVVQKRIEDARSRVEKATKAVKRCLALLGH